MPDPSSDTQTGTHAKPGIPFAEFVVMIAALMALNALAMDVMLPALPDIGHSLNILHENDRQQVLIAYLIGFGGAQLFYGPVTDAYGRRQILLAGLGIYAIASVASLMSQTLDQLLLARVLQGVGCAATRVIAVSVVRDCFTGRQMGRVMSLVMMIFMAVPIIAPSIGQVILLFADWRWIFTLLLFSGLIMLVWCGMRLRETLPRENRQPMNFSAIVEAYSTTIRLRESFGYTLALTFVFGGLFAFITMSQQIFVDIYGLGVWFPAVFAAIAVAMSVSSYLNARFVEAIGMRRLSHTAVLVFMALGVILYGLSSAGVEQFWTFTLISGALMACFGFLGANFNAMAMEPLGEIAGTASSVIGFITTLGGATLGGIMGHFFNGTTQPLGLAFALYGLCAIASIIFAEKGRMFRAHIRH
jgi:DHA1 family bicyclomycin/chloramphenicol resistance-like MFS transporter